MQESFEKISKGSSKQRTYVLIKKERGFESYLTEIKDMLVKKYPTTFRLSNHKLLIEVGRHQDIGQSVENEAHLFFPCPTYHYQLFLNLIIVNHPNLSGVANH